jgi:hypothetical protein
MNDWTPATGQGLVDIDNRVGPGVATGTARDAGELTMKEKAHLEEELDFLTTTLSTQVRTTALGVLILAWGLLIGDSPAARSVAGQLKGHLVAIGLMAILTITLDFGQYFAGYKNVRDLYDELEVTGKDQGDYDYQSGWYKLRSRLFNAKIVCLILAVAWLVVALLYWLIRSI